MWFKLGKILVSRKEIAMSETLQKRKRGTLSQQIEEKLAELAKLVSMQEYGPDGPPKELTFRQIEATAYRVGQHAAKMYEESATEQHQRHFQERHPCPQCGSACEPEEKVPRKLLTRLGPAELLEIRFHCDACRRSFFPSA